MRAQAIEKLGKLICEAVDEIPQSPDTSRLANLCTKYRILTDRQDNRSASVTRGVMNDRV